MPLDTQALPVSLEAQISWQDRGCSTAVERKPQNRKLMRSRVQITALKSFFYFISLSRVSLSRFVKEVQHFYWKMVAEQLSMDTASTIGTELAKRKLKPIENCRILNARTIFIFSFRLEQDSNQALIACRACCLFTGCDVTLLLSQIGKVFLRHDTGLILTIIEAQT